MNDCRCGHSHYAHINDTGRCFVCPNCNPYIDYPHEHQPCQCTQFQEATR